jgi:hypothetical protein
LAQTSGNQSLLGCKGSSLKAPAEFSSQTNLIENLLPSILERTETGSIDFEPFKQLEALLRGPIVQHNLDKYQRMLIKREDRAKVAEKRGNDGRLINPPKPKIPAQNLPELEHAFFQGIKFGLRFSEIIPSLNTRGAISPAQYCRIFQYRRNFLAKNFLRYRPPVQGGGGNRRNCSAKNFRRYWAPCNWVFFIF